MEQTVRKRGPRQPYRSYSPTRTRGGHLHELLLEIPCSSLCRTCNVGCTTCRAR